jgi:hypothetical protein
MVATQFSPRQQQIWKAFMTAGRPISISINSKLIVYSARRISRRSFISRNCILKHDGCLWKATRKRVRLIIPSARTSAKLFPHTTIARYRRSYLFLCSHLLFRPFSLALSNCSLIRMSLCAAINHYVSY